MAFCSKCGAQLNENSSFCAACGTPVAASQAVPSPPGVAQTPASAPVYTASAGMSNNVAGLLCYILGIITGIIFLVLEPYKNNRFVRFHAFQSIFFWVACCVIWMIWSWVIAGAFLSGGGLGSFGFLGLTFAFLRLLMFVCWIFLMVKAYGNEEYRLPIIGDLAAKQAGA